MPLGRSMANTWQASSQATNNVPPSAETATEDGPRYLGIASWLTATAHISCQTQTKAPKQT